MWRRYFWIYLLAKTSAPHLFEPGPEVGLDQKLDSLDFELVNPLHQLVLLFQLSLFDRALLEVRARVYLELD